MNSLFTSKESAIRLVSRVSLILLVMAVPLFLITTSRTAKARSFAFNLVPILDGPRFSIQPLFD